jgi:hypothetical protein
VALEVLMTTDRKGMIVVAAALFMAACNSSTASEQPAGGTAATAPSATVATASAYVVVPLQQPSGDLAFHAVLDLGQAGEEVVPQLRHAQVAAPKDWPASLQATFLTPQGQFACTAALIGPAVVLTAAHCVPPSGLITFTFLRNGPQPYEADCTQHPHYASHQDASADFALCQIRKKRPFVAPSGFLYETVDTSSMTLLLDHQLLLTGYGCVSDQVSDQRTDGKYRFGPALVDETSASPGRRRGPEYYAGREENNLFTVDDSNFANLCPGDSGGPAFRQSGTQVTDRTVVGVNSRVFYREASQTTYGGSMISATGGPAFRTWAENWTKTRGLAACGLNGALPNCRS